MDPDARLASGALCIAHVRQRLGGSAVIGDWAGHGLSLGKHHASLHVFREENHDCGSWREILSALDGLGLFDVDGLVIVSILLAHAEVGR